MENNNFDILKDLQENNDYPLNEPLTLEKDLSLENNISEEFNENLLDIKSLKEELWKIENNTISFSRKVINSIIFLIKYITTSSLIFWLLLLTTNYQAYFNIINAWINTQWMEKTKESLVASVDAMNLSEKKDLIEIKEIKKDEKIINNSFKSLSDTKKEDLSLKIDITPYENRIIIPSIWRNIPLVDIKDRTVKWQNELNDIFMQELEKWVIRYPWSAKPGEIWNSFIFWHSSNFPWIKWDYNEVFALLNNVKHGDKIIVYYNQHKYIYIINNKLIIKPWNVSVLKSDNKKRKISVMTCRPVWTTINRLVISWDIIEDKILVK